MTEPSFNVAVTRTGDGPTVATVTGDVDATNATDFLSAVEAVEGERPIVVDLSPMRYFDSAGFAALDSLLSTRSIVVVLDPDSPIRRAATLMGVPFHDTIASASGSTPA